MAAAVRVATFPFRALYRLIKVLFLPIGLGALTLWLGWTWSSWLLWATAVCGVWAYVMVQLWWTQLSGELQSLRRGTVNVRRAGRPRSGDRL